jgi:hypothetical protein
VGCFEKGSAKVDAIASLALAFSVLLLALATIGLTVVAAMMLACGAR